MQSGLKYIFYMSPIPTDFHEIAEEFTSYSLFGGLGIGVKSRWKTRLNRMVFIQPEGKKNT